MLQEFKKFILRGNVVDLAVAVIIGGAFGKIVASLVNDIVMPALGVLLAGINFTDLKIVLAEAVMEGDVVKTPEAAILYGKLIQVTVEFLVIGLVIFLVVKAIEKAKSLAAKKPAAEAAPAEPPPPPAPTEAELLAEIRDLLKGREGQA